MKELFNGVTKNDLLKLKNSKAVPITAHSHEVVVPVVYATRVKEFMRKEGMRVPLKPEELQTLKQKARQTEGEMEAYAKGGTIKGKKAKAKAKGKAKVKATTVIKRGNIKQIVNIKLGEKAKIIRRPSARAKAIGKDNIPIRPGVSTYAISNEPSYSRMIPSTGATTNTPLPTTATMPSAQETVKSIAGPIKAFNPMIGPPLYSRPNSLLRSDAEDRYRDQLFDSIPSRSKSVSPTPAPPAPSAPAQSRGRAILAARKK